MEQSLYELQYRQSVDKDLRKLPDSVRSAVVQKIRLLATNPRPTGSVKLRGSKDLYRIRSTDYRILYEIDDGKITILIVKVGHRKNVYRDVN